MKLVSAHDMKLTWTLVVSLGAAPLSSAIAEELLFDPTRPSAGGEAYESMSFAGPALQSTVLAAGERRAVISGRSYRVGDRLGTSVVAEILPYEVILRPAGGGAGETRLRMLPRLAKEPVPGKGSAP